MIAACVVVLLMVTYIPQISVCLPKAFAGSSYTGTSKLTDHADSTAGDNSSEDYNEIGDYSDLGWEEQTWNFACSTTETSTWQRPGNSSESSWRKPQAAKYT